MPKLKINIQSFSKNIETYSLTDKNNNKIELLKPDKDVSVILKFIGLKFLKQKVISEWSVVQLLSDFEKEENLITDNIDLEIENYLVPDTILDDDDDSDDDGDDHDNDNDHDNNNLEEMHIIENLESSNSDKNDAPIENKIEEPVLENNNNHILELTKEELNKYKSLLQENEIKYNELKNNIKKCLDL